MAIQNTWMNVLADRLKSAVAEKFGLNASEIEKISAIGKDSMLESMKQFVLKNGSKEVEEILFRKKKFEGSFLQELVNNQLKKDIQNKMGLDGTKASALSGFASDFLVDNIVDLFQNSGKSQNIEGVAEFLGIDKNLLKMVNSPIGKMFGKFF